MRVAYAIVFVSDMARSIAFYRDVMGAELVQRPVGWAYRFGDKQLNVHGKGVSPAEVARLLGVRRQSAHEWLKAWRKAGVRALRSKGAAGPKARLSARADWSQTDRASRKRPSEARAATTVIDSRITPR